jgi:hypothetical protein
MHGLIHEHDDDDDDDCELQLCIYMRKEKKAVKAKIAFGMRAHHLQLYR